MDSLRVPMLNIRIFGITGEIQIASEGYIYFRTKETQLDHVTREFRVAWNAPVWPLFCVGRGQKGGQKGKKKERREAQREAQDPTAGDNVLQDLPTRRNRTRQLETSWQLSSWLEVVLFSSDSGRPCPGHWGLVLPRFGMVPLEN